MEKVNECLGCGRVFCADMDAARKCRDLLDFWRQRTEIIDPGDMDEFADLVEADVDLSPRHHFAHH